MKIQKTATKFPKDNFQDVSDYATSFNRMGDKDRGVTLRFCTPDGKWTRIMMSAVEAATLSTMLANATKDRGSVE